MRAATEEEQRAEAYRHSAKKRRDFQRNLRRKLRGSAAARNELERNWKPLICDTSRVENRK